MLLLAVWGSIHSLLLANHNYVAQCLTDCPGPTEDGPDETIAHGTVKVPNATNGENFPWDDIRQEKLKSFK